MRILLSAMALGLCLVAPTTFANWIEKSDAITLDVLRAQAQFEPEDVGGNGLTGFDDQVLDLGPQAFAEYNAVLRAQVARLQGLLDKEKDKHLREDIQILIEALDEKVARRELKHATLIPFINVHEFIYQSVRSLLDPRNDKSRYPAALERLARYAGSAEGYEPLVKLAQARTSERFDVPGLVGPYRGELQNFLDTAPAYVDGIRGTLEASGLEGWEDDFALLQTQLQAYSDWVGGVLMQHARESSQLPPEVYANSLQLWGVESTPAELIEQARYSYQLLNSQMRALAANIAQQRGWEKKDLRSVIAALKAEQVPPDEVLPMYQQRLAQLEEIIRKKNIVTLPKRDAVIRLATEAESAFPASFMNPPQLINNTGQYGEFVLVQSNPALGDKGRMDDFSHAAITWTLTVHEARPGHELQFTRMVEGGVSLARAIFAFNSANVEGWALYAESVMYPYLPPEGQLFCLYSLSWRAARMFLDPMVNTGQLSRDGARDFLMEHMLLSEPMASSEADRYAFRLPGQATSYFYGYRKLMSLRTELEIILGDEFDQRAFHDFILQQGLLPPGLMREAVLEEFAP
ncbi:DUF885 domain-containing protein [Mangrovimicrobium sediminis]|uniref:DUF885 domain-containing protein n=1 Tax=Mangrovimicrobium sediminis TaxID=2562682 RepID=A0A4Z0LWP8_9GAMM|nr:DUF885 domain-containing protein [Haliea sp. SAOS-164]TGD71711.1 DUF885 domain-containing protein [Haliea sp. SAOS-164]